MIHELWYTSAPRGLYPGSRGFCTVKATRGIPVQLREVLEMLSSYEHHYPPNDPNAKSNPINFSHVIIQAGGRPWHVLSRIQDAGVDHTKRSNFFAHHIAIDSSTANSAGPAWLLRQPGFLESAWDHSTGEITSSRQLPVGAEEPRPCQFWRAVTGDAGWAGVVLDSLLNSKKQIYLLYHDATTVLPLVSECVALLPKSKRWDITFTTFFTKLPAGVNCALRCVLKGTQAERQLRQSGALIIDLTDTGVCPSEVTFVEQARAGASVQLESQAPIPHVPTPSVKPIMTPQPAGSVAIRSRSHTQPVPTPPPQEIVHKPDEKVRVAESPRTSVPKSTRSSWAFGAAMGAIAGMILACAVLLPLLLSLRSNLKDSDARMAALTEKQGEVAGKLTKANESNAVKDRKIQDITDERAQLVAEKQELADAREEDATLIWELLVEWDRMTYELSELKQKLSETQQELQAAKTTIPNENTAPSPEADTARAISWELPPWDAVPAENSVFELADEVRKLQLVETYHEKLKLDLPEKGTVWVKFEDRKVASFVLRDNEIEFKWNTEINEQTREEYQPPAYDALSKSTLKVTFAGDESGPTIELTNKQSNPSE